MAQFPEPTMAVHLSDAPRRKLRMGQPAFLASGTLCRLSNVVKRCEQRGWVVRTPDPADGRYTLAELTDAGFDTFAWRRPHTCAPYAASSPTRSTRPTRRPSPASRRNSRIVPDDVG